MLIKNKRNVRFERLISVETSHKRT